MNLVDTSGWVEYFFAGSNSSYFSGPIENIEELIVSVVCLYEVFKKVKLVSDESQALRAIAQMKLGRVINLTEDIALKASLVSIDRKLPMADSFIYATAVSYDATVWTQDSDFEGLPNVNYKAPEQ